MPTVTDTFTALAARMMTKFGTDATLSRVEQVYDEELDETVTTTTSSTILAVLEAREVENDNGKNSIETVLKSNSALAVNDRVTLAGKTYKVVSVEETAPSGTAFFWIAQVCAS